MNVHTADTYTISLADPILAEIISCARHAEDAGNMGDELCRAFWGRALKAACRKQYKRRK